MLFRYKQKTCFSLVRPGDIIGFSGDSWLSAGINLATYGIPFWGLSHVGIVGKFKGLHVIFESTSLSDMPCMVQEKKTSGTQAHSAWGCISAYRGKVWHYPLWRPLSNVESLGLTAFLLEYIGTNYDFIGAFRAGGKIWSWLESKLRQEDLTSLFCSELCVAAHRHVRIFKVNSASHWNPNRFVREERQRGILMKPRRIK